MRVVLWFHFRSSRDVLPAEKHVESAVANALDAKKAWLEAAMEDGIEIHEPDSLEDYSGQFKLRIPRKSSSFTCRTF